MQGCERATKKSLKSEDTSHTIQTYRKKETIGKTAEDKKGASSYSNASQRWDVRPWTILLLWVQLGDLISPRRV